MWVRAVGGTPFFSIFETALLPDQTALFADQTAVLPDRVKSPYF